MTDLICALSILTALALSVGRIIWTVRTGDSVAYSQAARAQRELRSAHLERLEREVLDGESVQGMVDRMERRGIYAPIPPADNETEVWW